jgi:hypothetical protein
MKARDATDPTSLEYQAQIHGKPDLSQPDQFRGQCQHRCWFFLPWHRLYLHWFDQVVLALVRASNDVDEETKESWALPYWNYSEGGQRATLPSAFREEQLPEGGEPAVRRRAPPSRSLSPSPSPSPNPRPRLRPSPSSSPSQGERCRTLSRQTCSSVVASPSSAAAPRAPVRPARSRRLARGGRQLWTRYASW